MAKFDLFTAFLKINSGRKSKTYFKTHHLEARFEKRSKGKPGSGTTRPLKELELDDLLDGDLSTYTLYRWSVVLLLVDEDGVAGGQGEMGRYVEVVALRHLDPRPSLILQLEIVDHGSFVN